MDTETEKVNKEAKKETSENRDWKRDKKIERDAVRKHKTAHLKSANTSAKREETKTQQQNV